MAVRKIEAPFKARARILSLLGDQLIGSDHLAIFELVKNAYDADAKAVNVKLNGLGTTEPSITIVDDGVGMDLDVLTGVWLEPASDYRELQRLSGKRSARFKRLPLGEKGVGRFAVHKLGEQITLTTRPRQSNVEYRIEINWRDITRVKYLENTAVEITEREPRYFTGTNGRPKHGTRIVISRLRRPTWTRADVRKLWRSITAISSPFDASDAFRAALSVPDNPDWLEDMPDNSALIEMAPWHFSFKFDGKISWSYEFKSPLPKRLKGRSDAERKGVLLVEPDGRGGRTRPVADEGMLEGIGPISGTIVAYDRDPKILNAIGQSLLVKDFLNEQGGIRVYRDGVRVHNYGEPNDDWLGLDIRRVNRPTQRVSRNIVLGSINLSLADSDKLREKTNREGFDENEAFERFRRLVTAVVHKFEVERAKDKDRLKKLIEDNKDDNSIPVEGSLLRLKTAIDKTDSAPKLIPLLDKVTQEYREMRDLLLRAGLTGINLAVVIHEVERGIRALHEAVRRGADKATLEKLSRSLMGLVESVAGLLRQKSKDKVDLRALVQEAAEINTRRYPRHQILVSYNLDNFDQRQRTVVGSQPLLLNVLINLIDNAIYWLRVRWPDVRSIEKSSRKIHIAITDDLADGIAVVVADNGPGFQDDPGVLKKPFFSRRPEGSGLGLYYASLAMSLSGGELVFPEKGDVGLPRWADGAIVAMHFNATKKR